MDEIRENLKKYYFKRITPHKLSFSFTWDDNFERHISWIGPIFEKYSRKCTFFINPGEPDFQEILWKGYKELALSGFEIGSHGYTHHHFSNLSETIYTYQLIKSKEDIIKKIGIVPITFAFPHHDFTSEMLAKAKEVYFETRNTLENMPRYSLKSFTTLNDIQRAVNNAISMNHSLVFSGHSISLDADGSYTDGYEPLPHHILDNALSIILEYQEIAEVCTFCQAALKRYIRNNCHYTEEAFFLNNTQLSYLTKFGLSDKRIEELV